MFTWCSISCVEWSNNAWHKLSLKDLRFKTCCQAHFSTKFKLAPSSYKNSILYNNVEKLSLGVLTLMHEIRNDLELFSNPMLKRASAI